MPTELDGVRARDDAPMLASPLSLTMSGSSGLHIHSSPEAKIYSGWSPSAHGPGDRAGQSSIPSTHRQRNGSFQGNGPSTYDPHASDLQTAGTPPSINPATHLNRQSSISQPGPTQNVERQNSNPTYGQAANFQSSNAQIGNAPSLDSQGRRTSFPQSITRQDSILLETQRRASNTRTNSGWRCSNAMDTAIELPTATSSPSVSSTSLKFPWRIGRRRHCATEQEPEQERKRRYFLVICILFLVMTGILIGFIVVLVFYIRSKGNVTEAALPTSILLPQANSMPITDSSIGAADVVIGTYFSTAASGVLQTKLAYNDGKGRLCVRTKSGTDWLNVQCLGGANPRADTPLTVLDWLGGPSIYFITADNLLSGIDHMPLNDTWKFSTLRDQKRPTHKRSQLASVTWFNGTSAWVYYQDANEQLREFGLDDYRGITWRDGSEGPLGLALAGSGIGASRWWLLSDGTEVLEVFVQVSGGALHGRVYMESVWKSDFYAVNGTPNTVSEGASLTSTVVHQTNLTVVMLAYVASDGYLTVQSRGTANQTNIEFDAFSTPQGIYRGDGGQTTGIAAFDSSGHPIIFFVRNDTILEFSAPDVAAANWTNFDVTSAYAG
ncbi:uncharacterized protein PAC_00035 [Phialocephala subalpina]|uniref:Fucose-specific lectin n=1 Tax=Phialocephala subalpina TaxID=576137 RepID=A0A1L7WBK9_9HELO|nr:uncharacterized protein PAC_00035 [Phialocephala subalpina]